MHKRRREMVRNGLSMWQGRLAKGPIGSYDEFEESQLIASCLLAFDPKWSTPDAKSFADTCEIVRVATPQIEGRKRWDKWADVLGKAIETANAIADVATLSDLVMLYHNYGRSLLSIDRYAEGEAAYLKAIQLARKAQDHHSEARACSNLGYYYVDQGHWWRSEILCCHALAIFEQLDNAHGKAHTYNHLGVVYYRQARWAESKAALNQAVKLFHSLNSDTGLLFAYTNLGTLAYETMQADRAVFWANKVIEIARKLGDTRSQGIGTNNLAAAYALSQDYDKAKAASDDTMAIYEMCHDPVGTARAHLNRGEILLRLGEYQQGMQHLDIAFGAFSGLSNADGMVEILTFLIDYHEQHSQTRLQQETLSRLRDVINDSYFSDEKLAAFDRYMKKLETTEA